MFAFEARVMIVDSSEYLLASQSERVSQSQIFFIFMLKLSINSDPSVVSK